MATQTPVTGQQSQQSSQQSSRSMPAQSPLRGAESEPALRAPVDIYEDSDGLSLIADLPGVSKERLDVRVEHKALVVEGTIEIPLPEQMQAVHADIRSTHYERRFALSDELDAQKIEASLKDGVLTVRIPKRAEAKPRRIEIKTQ